MTKQEEMKKRRKEVAHRRRIVLHSDGRPLDTLIGIFHVGGTQVTTTTYSLIHQFNLCRLYKTKVGQQWPPPPSYVAQGRDGLQVYIGFCRKNGVEAFWAMRMNDTHDAGQAPRYVRRFFLNQFKQQGYIVGARGIDIDEWYKPENQPPHGRWTSVDYGRPEVREQAFLLIQEVCEGYDVDGVMLDFFRHPTFFKSVAWGLPVSREELDMMTGLMRRIRKMAEEASVRRGRSILIAVRAPDSVGYCEGIGLDLERWMAEDLIDVWIAGGYFRLQPWEETVNLGHKYDVQVWASLDESRIWEGGRAVTHRDIERSVRNSLESYRAQVMNVWNAGADGVYLFNFFWTPPDPHYDLLKEIGDPQALEKLDKVYFVDVKGNNLGFRSGYFLKGGERFNTLPRLSPVNPLLLKQGETQTVTLLVGDDVLWGEAEGTLPELKLHIQVEKLAPDDHLSLKLNDKALNDGVLFKRWNQSWLEYILSPALVRKGMNRFEITLKRGREAAPSLHDMQLWIRYKKGSVT